MEMRRCRACDQEFPATAEHFVTLRVKQKNGTIWIGFASECRSCRNKRYGPYYKTNRKKIIARAVEHKEKRRKDPSFCEKDRQWSRESAQRRFADPNERAKATKRNRQWRKDNPDRVKQFKWNQPHMRRMRAMERYARKNKPAWADRERIAAIYAIADFLTLKTGIPHEVDHIYPLVHPKCCGLHVPWNLRVITASANQAKGNRLPQ